MSEHQGQNNGRDPAELEREIDRTRMSLGRTVDALENRLSPGQLLDQALGMARQHGGEFAGNLGRSVENNPVPMLLTAAGMAWMMMSSNEPRAARHPGRFDDVRDRTAGAKQRMTSGVDSAKSAAGSVSDRASRARHSVGDSVGHAGDRVRMESDRMRHGFNNLMKEQPLLVGAIGVAIGAALGAALPRSEAEDRLMGDVSDSAAQSAKDKANEAYEDVKGTASDVVARRDETGPDRTATMHASSEGRINEP